MTNTKELQHKILDQLQLLSSGQLAQGLRGLIYHPNLIRGTSFIAPLLHTEYAILCRSADKSSPPHEARVLID